MRFKYQTRWIAVLLALCVAAGQAASAQRTPRVRAVAAVSTTVADMDRAINFYEKVLTFEKIDDQEIAAEGPRLRTVRMKLGEESIELVQVKGKAGRPVPPDSRSNDRWFQHIAIIVSDMDRAYSVLRENHVKPASVAPQRLPDWNKNAAGIRAFYFKDPDGHPLEILQFPAGKGDPKWQSKAHLFLGIDHTAIVVNDTEASLKFYRDVLGFRIAGQGENYGPEQERLNNVPGAHLRITTLRADEGPGIELLEYLTPRNGRHLPYQARSDDLVHRHTILVADDPAGIIAALQEPPETPKSVGTAEFISRDPDGHELLIRGAGRQLSMGEVK